VGPTTVYQSIVYPHNYHHAAATIHHTEARTASTGLYAQTAHHHTHHHLHGGGGGNTSPALYRLPSSSTITGSSIVGDIQHGMGRQHHHHYQQQDDMIENGSAGGVVTEIGVLHGLSASPTQQSSNSIVTGRSQNSSNLPSNGSVSPDEQDNVDSLGRAPTSTDQTVWRPY